MTASKKLQQLRDNDKLTEKQRDCLADHNVNRVDDARNLFKDMLKENNYKYKNLSDADIITTLYNLLNYWSDDYVICDGDDGTVKLLDDDTLKDILDV